VNLLDGYISAEVSLAFRRTGNDWCHLPARRGKFPHRLLTPLAASIDRERVEKIFPSALISG
jgi:hypothetical protein